MRYLYALNKLKTMEIDRNSVIATIAITSLTTIVLTTLILYFGGYLFISGNQAGASIEIKSRGFPQTIEKTNDYCKLE